MQTENDTPKPEDETQQESCGASISSDLLADFTDGPWIYHQGVIYKDPQASCGQGLAIACIASKRRSDRLGIGMPIAPTHERDANGRLMAAAPKLLSALRNLADAADAFRADQKYAKDPRCGLVQPITVQEGQALNDALDAAFSILANVSVDKLKIRK